MTALTDAGPDVRRPTSDVSQSSIQVTNVSRWYGNVVAVNDVTFTLGAGVTGLLGPNGAGKTTILHMMAGLLRPSAGSVLIDGKPSAGDPEVYRKVGLIPEREAVYDYLTGFEFVRACARLHHLRDVDGATKDAIDLVDMTGPMHRRIATYSKGMKQRIKVAGAMVHDPAVLLLDEPFNGMDPRQRLHMLEVLRDLGAHGRVIVISSHILEELNDLASNILVMVAGRLAASGHFREIRRLMTDRPHTFRIRSSNDRKLAAALLADQSVFGVELSADGLVIRTGERGTLARNIARTARDTAVRVTEIRPTDESLESVFAYLVAR